jgi:hypothetical protein
MSGYLLHTDMPANHSMDMKITLSIDDQANPVMLVHDPIGYFVNKPTFKILKGQLAQRINMDEYFRLEHSSVYGARQVRTRLQQLVYLIPNKKAAIPIQLSLLSNPSDPEYNSIHTSRCSLDAEGCSVSIERPLSQYHWQ